MAYEDSLDYGSCQRSVQGKELFFFVDFSVLMGTRGQRISRRNPHHHHYPSSCTIVFHTTQVPQTPTLAIPVDGGIGTVSMLSHTRMFALGVGGEEDVSEEASASDAPPSRSANPRPG